MKTLFGYALLGTPTPEIGASTALGALTLVSSALLVLRGRRK